MHPLLIFRIIYITAGVERRGRDECLGGLASFDLVAVLGLSTAMVRYQDFVEGRAKSLMALKVAHPRGMLMAMNIVDDLRRRLKRAGPFVRHLDFVAVAVAFALFKRR